MNLLIINLATQVKFSMANLVMSVTALALAAYAQDR